MNELDTHQLGSQEMITRIFFRIYQCDNMINKVVTRALSHHGTTSQQWAVLGALSGPHASNGMTVGALSQFLRISRQNLTGVLTRLEKRKFIRKVIDSTDTRARLVRLTSEGKKVWRQMEPVVCSCFNELSRRASFDDNVAFLNRLNYLLKNLDNCQKTENAAKSRAAKSRASDKGSHEPTTRSVVAG